MAVVINQKHLSLNEKLAKEINKLSRRFNTKDYSKIENIDNILLKRDISVEKKKGILIRKLHDSIIRIFSIDKNKFNRKTLDSLKKRLHNTRKIVIKLRSINYYLETMFIEDLMASKINVGNGSPKIKKQDALVRDDLEALEYTTYKLIGQVIMLDKRLLREYSHREKKMVAKERIEVKDLGLILNKESELLEHLEAKLPPPKQVTAALMKEPIFTHWVARIFALLSYLEHLCNKEAIVFSKLKKNKAVKIKISKKILQLAKERSKLLKIIEEKGISMMKSGMDSELKKELHNLTITINL